VMMGCNVCAADTEAEAKRLFTSSQQAFAGAVRGSRGQLPPPINDIESFWSPAEKAQASHMLTYSFVGAPDQVREQLADFVRTTGADEVMANAMIYDHAARRRTYEIFADIARGLKTTPWTRA